MRAIVIGGGFPQHLGRIVDIVAEEIMWDGENPATCSPLYRVDLVLRADDGKEIYWSPQHLAILPPEVNDEVENSTDCLA